MANLYEYLAEFRVYDMDGVFLAAPGDYITTREVDGFDQIDITLERDEDTHGCFFEFGGEDQQFGFDLAMGIDGETYEPFQLISAILGTQGVDGKVEFEYLVDKGSGLESQYRANLDLETAIIIDYKLSVNARRITLSDLFRTRIDTPVNFGDTESIDGTPITGLTPESMFLHSKAINFDQHATSDQAPPIGADALEFSGSNTNFILQMDYVTEKFSFPVEEVLGYNNEIGVKYSQGVSTFLYEDEPITQWIFDSDGAFNIDYVCEYNLSLTNFGATTVDYLGTFLIINSVKIDQFNSAISFPPSGSSSTTLNIEFSFSGEYSIRKGDKVAIYDLWTIPRNTGITQTWKINPNIPASGNDHRMTLEFKSVAENSESETYNPFDSFNHILEVINNSANLLISDFWTNIGDEIYLTNGYHIRGFDNRTPIVDFKTLFSKWAQPMFGLGYAIVDDSGAFKVLMERYSEFYQDNEIDFIDVIINDSFELVVDKSLRFNEIKVGYKDFPKSTDENKSGNLDEYNTVQNILTPIETVKKKEEYVSEVIASGFKIENQRREQFKDVPADTVSDDEKIFCVKSIESDEYTDLSLSFILSTSGDDVVKINGTGYNLNIGDVITFSNTSSNNAPYTISDIEFRDSSGILTTRLSLVEPVAIEAVSGATMTLSLSFLRAERNEAFDVINNVINESSIYNGGINPKYMLANQSLLINSGFNPKPDTALVKTQDAKLNGEAEFQFKSGEGGYVLDPDKETVRMDGDLQLSQLNSYNRLFDGILIKFKANITYDRVLAIRDAYLNQAVSSNYGYIRMKDPFEQERKGYLMSMIYNPLREEVEFTLRAKFDPEGSSFDYVLDLELN